jgi:glycosyltransferase involved in cell wall biosynthesis
MQSAMAPLLSVVIPTRNRPQLLGEALRSLAEQTLHNWEAIVVDDASTEAAKSADVARCCDSRVRVIHHATRQGGSAAKNTGLRAATGRLITFLDDDDLLAPEYLARASDLLQRHEDLDGTFMNVARFGDRQHLGGLESERAMDRVLALAAGSVREPGLLVFGSRLFDALLHTVPMAFQRIVVRRDALRAIG